MNTSVYYIALDLHRAVAPHVISLKRGDTARELHITLTDNGAPYVITDDCTAELVGYLPIQTAAELPLTAEENVLSATIPSSWVTTAGEIVCEVRVYSGTSLLLISPSFSLYVGTEFGAAVTITQMLPLITNADDGKILVARNGVWDKSDAPPVKLPIVSPSDNGKILRVANGEWDAAEAELPAVSSSDDGKVLAAVDGTWGMTDALATAATTSETITQSITVQPWTPGYMVQNGTTYENELYIYSQHISVNAGDVITMKRSGDSGLVESARFVTIFANGSAVSDLGGANAPFPYTVPQGAEEVVFSISASYGADTTGKKTYVETDTTIYPKEKPDVDALLGIVANKKPNRLEYSFDLTAGTPYQATDNLEDMAEYEIVFNGKFTGTYSGVTTIDKRASQTYGGAFAFDDTNLYEYTSGNDSTPVRTQAHGLTLKDYVGVIITLDLDGKAHVTISTNGGTYTWNVPYWRSNYGVLKVSSTLTSFSDCTLSYSVRGLKTENWLYGDSYFGNTSTDKWTSYLVSLGFKNYLLNGYAGRNSATGLASLKKDLSMNRVPRRIIWCLGMNDSDKDYLPDPNPDWKSVVDELAEICADKHIELILATIPNVTSTDYVNSAKNAYVVASGYRYIDFANAISADGSSTWYDNMLGADGIHPKTQGAIALFNCAVAEVPELLS